MIRPDIKNDKLVLEKEIHYVLEGVPTMNFKKGQIDSFSNFHYNVTLYSKADGAQYYLFHACDDCTLYIMNCNKNIYDMLEKDIDIDDTIAIFDYDPKRNDSLEFTPIPEDYRNTAGGSSIQTMFFD